MTVPPDCGPRGLRNVRLVVAYDGTPYLGWQVQPQGPTVQSVLQDAWERISGERVTVKGSGRTDAGVHALAQVANFTTATRIAAPRVVAALNSVLPASIAVLTADDVDLEFDAQFSAVGKLYRYRVFNSRVRSPFECDRSWTIPSMLDIETMSIAARNLLGTHDFSSFRASGCAARIPVRSLTRCDISTAGDIVSFDLEADGFLRHMVRNIVGTLVDIGRRRFSTADIVGILAARDRAAAGISAPARGLYLVRVFYDASGRSAAPDTDRPSLPELPP